MNNPAQEMNLLSDYLETLLSYRIGMGELKTINLNLSISLTGAELNVSFKRV